MVLVLVVTLLVGLAALSTAFTVTLDSLAARNDQEAALAEGQAEGALALGALAASSLSGDAAGTVMERGPWANVGLTGTAEIDLGAGGVVSVEGRAHVGRSKVHRRAVLRLVPGGHLLLLSRP